MDTLSLPHSRLSSLDIDLSGLMDTNQDLEHSQDGVRWVASQSPNPALQALMKEAEREKRSRTSTPVHEPTSWTYPLASAATSPSFSASIGSLRHPSANSSVDASYLIPMSGTTSFASSSLAFRASELPIPRRAKPPSAGQRKPLASSTSSTNQPLCGATRSRSSSYSTALSLPSTSNISYPPKEEEPEAVAFIELLRDVSRQLDENSKKKQRLATRTKEKERSLGRSGINNRANLDTSSLSARPLTKTSSASAICSVGSSTRAIELTSSASLPISKPELRGRTLGNMTSLDRPGFGSVSGKSTPTSLPNHDLNRDPKLAPVGASNTHRAAERKVSIPKPTSLDVDTTMLDAIDLTETDTEWEQPISRRTDTIMSIQMDGDASDSEMDVSFFRPEPAPQSRVLPLEPKLQPLQQLPSAPTQRFRTGPPPLGMRRMPQLQPSQYGMSQGPKGVATQRFKPPLLANHNAGGPTNKSRTGTKPAATTSAKSAPRGGPTNATTSAPVAQKSQDPDSSFDVSFDVDADALEEAMKAYD